MGGTDRMVDIGKLVSRVLGKGKDPVSAGKMDGASGGGKFAEKIVLGFENPKTSKKLVVMYRYVGSLDQHYIKTLPKDSTGCIVGVLHERIYDTIDQFYSVFDEFIGKGWIFEAAHAEDLENKLRDTGRI